MTNLQICVQDILDQDTNVIPICEDMSKRMLVHINEALATKDKGDSCNALKEYFLIIHRYMFAVMLAGQFSFEQLRNHKGAENINITNKVFMDQFHNLLDMSEDAWNTRGTDFNLQKSTPITH